MPVEHKVQGQTARIRTRLNGSKPEPESESIDSPTAASVAMQVLKGWSTRNQLKLPKWMRDNEFIVNWHRPQLQSVATCFMSVFRLHSETGNIWTHLIGFIVILCLAFRDMTDLELHVREKLAFGVSYFSSAVCLSMSAAFHTLCCHSASVASVMSKLDYAGIAVMITGSFFTWIFYDFYCRSSLQLLYICVVGLMGAVAIALSLLEKFAKPEFRTIRAVFFAAFGLFGVVPATNSVWLHGWDLAFEKSVCWCAIMAACYLTGAALYASRIPERLFPGKCDILCQSHQLFHICVLLGMASHFYGCWRLANYVIATEINPGCGKV